MMSGPGGHGAESLKLESKQIFPPSTCSLMCHGYRYKEAPNTCGLEEKPEWTLTKDHENTWFFGTALLCEDLEQCECRMRKC